MSKRKQKPTAELLEDKMMGRRVMGRDNDGDILRGVVTDVIPKQHGKFLLEIKIGKERRLIDYDTAMLL